MRNMEENHLDQYPQWAESHFYSFLTSDEKLTKVISLMSFFFSKSALGFTDKRMIYARSTLLSTKAYDIEAPKIKAISLISETNILAVLSLVLATVCIIYSINIFREPQIRYYGMIFVLLSIFLYYIGFRFLKLSKIVLTTYYEKEYSYYYGTNPKYTHYFIGNSWKLEEAIKYIREWEYSHEKLGKKENEEVEVETIEEVEVLDNNVICNQCGNPAIYIKEFGKWYCEACKTGIVDDK